MLLGPARPAAEGGGFEAFPFYKLAGLSDEPSRATNKRAGAILRQLGLSEDKVTPNPLNPFLYTQSLNPEP